MYVRISDISVSICFLKEIISLHCSSVFNRRKFIKVGVHLNCPFTFHERVLVFSGYFLIIKCPGVGEV